MKKPRSLETQFAVWMVAHAAARQVLVPAHPERSLYDWTFLKVPLRIAWCSS